MSNSVRWIADLLKFLFSSKTNEQLFSWVLSGILQQQFHESIILGITIMCAGSFYVKRFINAPL